MIREDLEIEEPDVDERGDALGFDALVVQLFEFMLTLAGSSRYRPLIAPCLDQLVYLSLGAPQCELYAALLGLDSLPSESVPGMSIAQFLLADQAATGAHECCHEQHPYCYILDAFAGYMAHPAHRQL